MPEPNGPWDFPPHRSGVTQEMRGERAAEQKSSPLDETGVECFGGRALDVAIVWHTPAGFGNECQEVGRIVVHSRS